MTPAIATSSRDISATSGSLIAVVIPVFRHSALFLEAIASIKSACDRNEAHIIIVDDGCPHLQTVISGVAAVGDNVHYVRQLNRGLSGARNCGIEFVLTYLPECQAIYFLDADNRLSSYSFDRFSEALKRCPEIDWFYPDITMFGIGWNGDYSGQFRCLTEVLMNICEAGSLVRRRVFEEGCRFDEKMRAGYEDWEFWISLMERGFMGAHLSASGFNYRKRAESMLVESSRRHQEIMEYVETKHPWMRDLSTLIELEHLEAPRFAVVCSDFTKVLVGSDPLQLSELSLQQYFEKLHLSLERPNWTSAGCYLVFASQDVLDRLKEAALLRAAFWRAEIELQTKNFAFLSVTFPNSGFIEQKICEHCDECDLIFMKMSLVREVLADASDLWIRSVINEPKEVNCSFLSISAPNLMPPDTRWRKQQIELYEFMLKERSMSPARLWSARGDRHEGTPDLTLLPEKLRQKFKGGILPCSFDRTLPKAAFILPVMEFGGVEKVAFQVARQFRRGGYRVDVIIYGVDKLYRYDAFTDAYDDIYIFDHVKLGYGGPIYDGTWLPSDLSLAHPEIGNLLAGYDVVVNCHAAGVLNCFADLKRAGVTTVNYIHLLEYSEHGRVMGHPVIALAYEHTTDLVACCSLQMAAQAMALGIPREKVVAVPNGVGADITSSHVTLAGQLRKERSADQPLKVLYFGRLDGQKGLDRLSNIVAVLGAEPSICTVRIVGGSIVDATVLDAELATLVEPPIYNNDLIAELYSWADILVMPSRFEGLPLAIVEAMTLGCVPIATDVGAISEIIESGENGYVVPNDTEVAARFIAILRSLAKDPDELARLSANAMAMASKRSWELATDILIDRVNYIRSRRSSARRRPKFRPLLDRRTESSLPRDGSLVSTDLQV